MPFPPKDEFYGPSYVLPDHVVFGMDSEDSRRQSLGSTIADLLNNYVSDVESLVSDGESELQNLDWSDWEDEDIAPQDIQNYYELLKAGFIFEQHTSIF